MEFFSDGLYQFTFTWTIENVTLSPEKPRNGISSPPFIIHALAATKWRLVLIPRGIDDPAYMSLLLCREREEGRIGQVTVNFKFSIETAPPFLRSTKLAKDVLFEEGDCWGYSRYLRRGYLSKVLAGSTDNSLTLHCDIGSSIGAITNYKWDENVDFQMMSNNLMTLYRNESFADVTLCCGGAEIKVHRCVLAARLPKLLSQLRLLKNGQLVTYCNIFNTSLPVLKSLLFYAYSGKLDRKPSEITPELLEAAYKCELPELIRKLKSYPRFCSARSTYKVEHKSFAWNIRKRTLLETNPTRLVRIIPTDALYADNIAVSCAIQADSKCEFVQQVLLTFQIADLRERLPIFVSCRVYVGSLFSKLFGFCAADHLFHTEGKWTLPVGTNNASFEDVVELHCELDLCDGDVSSAIRDSWMSSHESTAYLNDYSELSTTMSRLFSRKCHSDFTIVAKGQTFAVHSAILAARSPVFCKMLEHDMLEKNRREVVIRDTSPATMQLMLSYMYSGTVRELEYDEAIDVYEAADKYCILVLKERCASILVSKLTSRNARQLLELADMHFDNIMTKQILECYELETEMHELETEMHNLQLEDIGVVQV